MYLRSLGLEAGYEEMGGKFSINLPEVDRKVKSMLKPRGAPSNSLSKFP